MPSVLLFVGDRTVAALLRPAARALGYTLEWTPPLRVIARARALGPLFGLVLGRPDAALDAALRKALPGTPLVTLPRLAPPTLVFDCPFDADALLFRLETALQRARA